MNSDIKSVDDNINGLVKLQTDILKDTKNFLRLESVRRHISMGMLIDELVKDFSVSAISEKTS